MKILITGSGGFIGKNLKKALRKQKPFCDSEIVALKRDKALSSEEYVIDYSNIESLVDCNACSNVDYAFHLAGITKGVSAYDFYRANVLPTENLLKALNQKSPKLMRFVFTSSQAAAGPSKNRHHYKTEFEEECPVEHYGRSKLLAEKIVKDYHAFLPCTILRPGSVYGPEDVDFLNIFKMASSGINIYAGNKKKYTSIIYIDDLVDGMLKASLSDKAISKTYFICNDEPISWQQMHETIFKAMNKEPLSISIPSPFIKALSYLGDAYSRLSGKASLLNVQKIKLSEPSYWIASNENAKNDFGFTPRIPLEVGVRLTYEHYVRNKQL